MGTAAMIQIREPNPRAHQIGTPPMSAVRAHEAREVRRRPPPAVGIGGAARGSDTAAEALDISNDPVGGDQTERHQQRQQGPGLGSVVT